MPSSRFASLARRSVTTTLARRALSRPELHLAALLVLANLASPGQPARAQGPSAPEAPKPESRSAPVLGLASERRRLAARLLGSRQSSRRNPELPAAALAHAREQHAALAALPRLSSLTANWQALGPTSVLSASYGAVTGRVTALALDPNDTTGNTLYMGTSDGGVWKATNAAGTLSTVSFTPLTDTLPVFAADAGSAASASLSIGALAVQPAPNPVVLAGTGDPNDATDSLYGEGLLRSTDGGLTWTLIRNSHDGTAGNHSLVGLSTAGIAFSTATPSLVVAAFSDSVGAFNVAAVTYASVPGLYFSTDSGQTWQMSTVYDGTQVIQEPEPLGSSNYSSPATSVVWDAQRGRFYAAIRGHGYYSSSDGATWSRLAAQPGAGLTSANCAVAEPGLGAASCPIYRGTLAVQPATGDLYALTVDANDKDQGLWQDLCNANASGQCANNAPTFATRLDNGALEAGSSSGTIAQGNYNLALAAAPAANGATDVFVGTVDLYRCSIAANGNSCALRNTTNALDGCNAPAAVAPAQHALATMAQGSGSPLLFLGNDGGLWRSLDGVAQTGAVCSASDARHFDNLNLAIGKGGSLAEVIGFASDPASPDTLLVGLGANGSAATTTATSLAAWQQLSAGEGGYPSIDPANPLNWFVTVGSGANLKACTRGSNCTTADFLPPATIGDPQTANDNSLLEVPTLLDPGLTSNVLMGTCRVWRGPATDGTSWSSSNTLSTAFDNGAASCTASNGVLRSLAAGGPVAQSSSAAASGSTVLYAGLAGLDDGGGTLAGHLFTTNSANTSNGNAGRPAWTDVAQNPVTNDFATSGLFNPEAFDISSVAIDPHDATGGTVYVTIQGFSTPHIYRSVDFGAHWTNITSNLPSAPANAVVVDPNDANTIYVAVDAGVYATTSVNTCTSSNCWSVLGVGLPNAPAVALHAEPNLPTGDGRRGMLRVGTYGRGIWQQPLLNAISLLQPALTASPTALTFVAQQVSTLSAPQTITITSSGNAPATISTLSISTDFTERDTCSGHTLPVGSTCTVAVSFAPTATGARAGTLTIYGNIAGGGQIVISLTGTATAAPDVVLTPLSLTFPATIVNNSAAAQIITVANTGGNPATLTTPVITGDFSLSADTCTATLAPQTACSLSVTFTPTTSGTRNGTLTISGSAGVQTATLTGVGNAPATDTLSPSSITFAQQQIGSTSSAQTVTLTNAGDVPLTLITASITGSDFTATNSCGNSLAAHSTCAVSVTFVPTATGTRNASLTVTDQFRTQTVALSGTGVAPPGVSISPSILSFPATGVGLAAPAQTVTLTNNGGLPLTLSGTTTSSGFVVASSNCPGTLAVNAACTLTVIFSPTAAGPATGTLTLTDNAPSGSQTTSLSGTGVDFSLTPDGATAATISSGSSASYALLLSSIPALSGNVAFACSGAPAHSTCTVSPSTPQLGSTTVVSVTIATGLTTALLEKPSQSGSNKPALLALLILPAAFWSARRRRVPRLLVYAVAVSLATLHLAGCGTGRIIPAATAPTGTIGSTPTPGGNYNVTITGTAAGLSHSVGLTLTVQ